jgi:hypothetical protein
MAPVSRITRIAACTITGAIVDPAAAALGYEGPHQILAVILACLVINCAMNLWDIHNGFGGGSRLSPSG